MSSHEVSGFVYSYGSYKRYCCSALRKTGPQVLIKGYTPHLLCVATPDSRLSFLPVASVLKQAVIEPHLFIEWASLATSHCRSTVLFPYIIKWGKDTYCCPRGPLKPDEDEKERTRVLSRSLSISAWSRSTGRFSYTALNTRYDRSCSTSCTLPRKPSCYSRIEDKDSL
jgi:hypothetical protein